MGGQQVFSAQPAQVPPDAFEAALERVLESRTFRNSDALRRLLRFLADKMLAGEADQLKEYSVGIDALGERTNLGRDPAPFSGTTQIMAPDETAALIDQLRTAGITLTYDPDTRTLHTSDSNIAAVAVSQDC